MDRVLVKLELALLPCINGIAVANPLLQHAGRITTTCNVAQDIIIAATVMTL